MAREIPGNALYFTSYEFFRQFLPRKQFVMSQNTNIATDTFLEGCSTIISGGLAGCVMWFAVLPIDAAKTRIQTAFPGSLYDQGILDQMRTLYCQGGGIRGLYPGLMPTLVRAFFANACQWSVWEICMRCMK
eukprot:TRINITY_DN61100_c0_g1_i1.p2 TRINITY_DN61100_c0_g1~~TRINITY_DN61100_c0_g1_i1.p2  ORF type:complete len:132 (-),score=12.39 TRINITY_DN61100_c0_g1_i1:109-504(-)